jgi:hypothetical protein
MSKYTRRLGAPIFVILVAGLGACSRDAKKGPDTVALGADTSLNRDLALANRDTAAKPQLNDVPAATPRQPERVAPRPARREPAREPARERPRNNPNNPTSSAPTPAPLPPVEPPP